MVKLLKEYSSNKQTVAKTLLKLGEEGEKALFKLLLDTPGYDYKLKSAIIKALSSVSLRISNLDLVVETILKLTQ